MPKPVLILLNPKANNPQKLAEIRAFVQAHNGRTVHSFPNQAVIAKVPVEVIAPLASLPEVATVLTEPVEPASLDAYGPHARRWITIWNALITRRPVAAEDLSGLEAHPLGSEPDAFEAPDLPSPDDLSIAQASTVTPGYHQTSEFLAGSIAVGIVLVESNGNVDPSTEDWKAEEKELVLSEIVAALDWWAELEPRAKLSFVYDDHGSNPLPTGVEPITRPYVDQAYWIADAMAGLGYRASSYFSRVRDYNNDLRRTYQTDWAFTIFVVDSSADSDNRFSDGYFAYAYLGGPFMVITYGNNGYGPHHMDAVVAHEMGHVFHARDQYASAAQSCTYRSGYLNVENQNSQSGGCLSNEASIMRGQVFPYQAGAIDRYAAGQVGWRDSDGDDVLDPLDTDLRITIDQVSQDGTSVTVSGAAEINPYPSPSRASVTINRLVGVKFCLDERVWLMAEAEDGSFDETTENYHFTLDAPSPGRHKLDIAALDSAGNISDSFATQIIEVLDPIDGPLNTDLYPPSDPIPVNTVATIEGSAYHMAGGRLRSVEYRFDGGPWQSTQADDGNFDSDDELFRLTFNTQGLSLGAHRVEARAVMSDGYTEVNVASLVVEVADQQRAIFIPIVMKK